MSVAIGAGVILEHTSGALFVSISVSSLREVFPDDVADEARSPREVQPSSKRNGTGGGDRCFFRLLISRLHSNEFLVCRPFSGQTFR